MSQSRHVVTQALLLMTFLTYSLCTSVHAQIVCNQFNIVTNLRGSVLDLSVQTDLPDNTALMVRISRSYKENGSSATYSCDYLSEKSTVGKWKKKNTVSLDDAKWQSALREKQKDMSRLGAGFQVASISDKVNVRMVVPINQPDPKFGKDNSKLSGIRVAPRGFRVVEAEETIHYPLVKYDPVTSMPSFNPNDLTIGQAYVLSKDTPLMPELDPADISAALQKVKLIPKGGIFKIYEVRMNSGTPWYRIRAHRSDKKAIGEGWINSTALYGQALMTAK